MGYKGGGKSGGKRNKCVTKEKSVNWAEYCAEAKWEEGLESP